jgi:hypothetical protein
MLGKRKYNDEEDDEAEQRLQKRKRATYARLGPRVNDVIKLLNKRPLRFFVIGRSGTGKTTLAFSLYVKYLYRFYDQLYIISPSAFERDPQYSVLMQFTEPDKIYTEVSHQVLCEVSDRISQSLIENPDLKTMLFIDDCASDPSTNTGRKGPFADMVIRAPHLNLSIIGIFQQPKTASLALRDNAEVIIQLAPTNSNEMKIIKDEFFPIDEDPEKAKILLRRAQLVWNKHGFVTILKPPRRSWHILKNFDMAL